jgi:LPS-assembly lipoprotein
MSWSEAGRFAAGLALALSLGGCLQPLYGEAAHPGLTAQMQAIYIEPISATRPVPPIIGARPEYLNDPAKESEDAAKDKAQPQGGDRFGHYLRDDLIFNFNGTGQTPPPKYRLTVTATASTTTPTVESQTSAADAATLTVFAKYVLTPYGGGKPIVSSDAVSSAVYDLSYQRFANLRAARDAEIRLAKSIADEMELRIAAALAEQAAP